MPRFYNPPQRDDSGTAVECVVCQDTSGDTRRMTLPCTHAFCASCGDRALCSAASPRCPLCKAPARRRGSTIDDWPEADAAAAHSPPGEDESHSAVPLGGGNHRSAMTTLQAAPASVTQDAEDASRESDDGVEVLVSAAWAVSSSSDARAGGSSHVEEQSEVDDAIHEKAEAAARKNGLRRSDFPTVARWTRYMLEDDLGADGRGIDAAEPGATGPVAESESNRLEAGQAEEDDGAEVIILTATAVEAHDALTGAVRDTSLAPTEPAGSSVRASPPPVELPAARKSKTPRRRGKKRKRAALGGAGAMEGVEELDFAEMTRRWPGRRLCPEGAQLPGHRKALAVLLTRIEPALTSYRPALLSNPPPLLSAV